MEDTIHYNIGGKYACNWAVHPTLSKLTLDKKIVTCLNCKKILKEDFKDDNNSFK